MTVIKSITGALTAKRWRSVGVVTAAGLVVTGGGYLWLARPGAAPTARLAPSAPSTTPSKTPIPTATSVVAPRTPVPTRKPQPAAPVHAAPQHPRQPHLLVLMEENRGYAATLGSCGPASPDPYWCSLAAAYTSVTRWYAVSHPSLPNYLAIDSGATQNCSSDSCATGYGGTDLGGQLIAARIPWKAFMETMPSPCFAGGGSNAYARKHNPFVYFKDVTTTPQCSQDVVPYPGAAGLVRALDGPGAPSFVWLTPNVVNDMHDGGAVAAVKAGDNWMRANLAAVLTSSWFVGFDSTVIVTMDENDAKANGSCCGNAAGGQVPLVVISNHAKGRGNVSAMGSHYGLLRSIEESFGLPFLGAAASAANGDLTGFFG